ncbi:tetratricopeptide repeat protein [Haloferula sp. A504]|uniref:tetratricopeptide repeat protein n=1 Tax=Haloferula sp. A504 TaxID=3373601 RepID=UPI0031C1D4EA|nr:tetratricopeptide repeat protein [Verrucomicrobiaceae bacterium E54]
MKIQNSLNHLISSLSCAGVIILAVVGPDAGAQTVAGQEITYPGDAFAKLDTFEGLNLEDADKLYNKGDYKGAFAAYKAYSFEFAKSRALPYVLLRMGRCLHQLEKRNAAIKAYQDVVDYFPDDVRYAAAALFYIGQCHGQNGDTAKQTAVWARMVKDDDYVAQPNSGTALTFLGNQMAELGKFGEAAEYQWRTAVNFLQSNPNAAKAAREAVIAHYARRSPDHDKLTEFYVAASGFDGRGIDTGNPEEDVRYWTTALSTALDSRADKEVRQRACSYWAAKLGDKFADNDSLRKLWADALMVAEEDRESWVARLEKQFKSKPKTIDRVLQFCDYLRAGDLRSAFFKKEGESLVSQLKTEDKIKVMNRLRHPLGMHDEAQMVMRSVSLNGMTDEQLRNHGFFVANYEPEESVLRYFARMKDKLAAAKARFDYYKGRSHRNRPNAEKALAEIPALQKSPDYAGSGLMWAKGELLREIGEHGEAIKAFRAANREPDTTWAVIDCLVAMKQYPQAIKEARQLMTVSGQAPRASLKIADIHRVSGDKAREVDQLRAVLKQFPKSGESSEAHRRLEGYGVALVGGEAEAVE